MDKSNNKNYLIRSGEKIKTALNMLEINKFKILFVVNKSNNLVGSISDGDIRRSLLKFRTLNYLVDDFMNKNPRFLSMTLNLYFERKKVLKYGINIAPLVDKNNKIVKILDLKKIKFFPVDIVIMAGGRGQRLSPLTDNLPKPLIKLNDKPIIEIIYDSFIEIGAKKIFLSINYLKDKIKSFFNSKYNNDNIEYIEENFPMGTFGSLSLIKKFDNDIVLVINSDILTNINFELFYEKFLQSQCDFALIAINHKTIVQYAILKERNNILKDFVEKPKYDNYINTGIYLMKKDVISEIPKNKFYNATDLLRKFIEKNKKIYIHKVDSYWKDIGKIDDLNIARNDINKIL
tara:strand:+ start:301 stop:1341 length:1041 start_codon:yes stop_codon:yes gene_type:complete